MTVGMQSASDVSQRLARIEEVLKYQTSHTDAIKRRLMASEQRCQALENKVSYLFAMIESVRKECSDG